MTIDPQVLRELPRALNSYPAAAGQSLLAELSQRARLEPVNVVATVVFVLAIAHTFTAGWFTGKAHRIQHHHDATADAAGSRRHPSVVAELLHFLGEVEVVFGLWALVLALSLTSLIGWTSTTHYLNDTVDYTEPLFVVVIMALAATRPIVGFAEASLRRIANLGQGTAAAWWVSILVVGPLLGSFITEPAAMTISALLLARQFFDLEPSPRLKYATLGLLFVNISIGGTLTHFGAPPVLMVARAWDWDLAFMMRNFAWRAIASIGLSTLAYFALFRRELVSLGSRPPVRDAELPEDDGPLSALLPVPGWLVAVHVGFIVWTVVNSHHPALFIGGFLFFIGVVRATSAYQSRVELKTPLLVGFFLAGLVIHGGLQGWWISPLLERLDQTPLFLGAMALTAINDNALITYLATLVPHLDAPLKLAVVEGAVVGGGLTVIANAPNPAGQALLSRFFGGAPSPIYLLAAAALPTVLTALVFWWL